MKRIIAAPNRRVRAFTLLELLVVIGIISVLVSIVLVIGVRASENNRVAETENVISILDTALKEWENRANRKLTWGLDDVPVVGVSYDMDSETYHIFTVAEAFETIARSSDIRAMLGQISETNLVQYKGQGAVPTWLKEVPDYEPDPGSAGNGGPWQAEFTSGDLDGSLAILDGWDLPIRLIHPGRPWSNTPPFQDSADGILQDKDGTIRTPLEIVYGSCKNGQPYFMSGGSDKRFGNLDLSQFGEDEPGHQAAHDNIASYEPEHP